MRIQHYIKIEGNKENIYLNIVTEDIYEFGSLKDSKTRSKESDKIKEYFKKNIAFRKGSIVTIIINGVLIGTIALSAFLANTPECMAQSISASMKSSSNTEIASVLESKTLVAVDEEDIIKQSVNTNKESNYNTSLNTSKPATSNTNKAQESGTTSTIKDSSLSSSTNDTTNTIVSENKVATDTNKGDNAKGSIYINLNNKGVISSIELEEYIVGVVAAEMPASFSVEALKAQAVAARTYTVKKASAGKTLVNSTSDQVYNTVDEMKAKWGSSFNTYYNKIKSAVSSTKGLVITYNGKYIDALYCSMTNGKTEQPEYVWAYSYPYLKCVSSSWDKNVKGFETVKNLEYATVSKALGQTVTRDTVIEILYYTVSGRVDKIKIGDKTYTGVEIRTKLGLRSTDFTIDLNDSNISITTRGFGHGVGLSQYGANEMAKQGYTYDKILHHYYTGITISKCEKL